MSAESSEHGQDHSELLYLYALQALPASEAAGVATQISACVECRQELETLRPVIDACASWPAEVLRPSPSLWERLARRIAGETGDEPLLPAPRQWAEPEWNEVAPGLACKVLATDLERDRISMLVRLAPGTDYPAHRHHGIEELYLLHGELVIDDATLRPGDYRRADPGTVDHRIWSKTGCACLLMTSLQDAILSPHPPQSA